MHASGNQGFAAPMIVTMTLLLLQLSLSWRCLTEHACQHDWTHCSMTKVTVMASPRSVRLFVREAHQSGRSKLQCGRVAKRASEIMHQMRSERRANRAKSGRLERLCSRRVLAYRAEQGRAEKETELSLRRPEHHPNGRKRQLFEEGRQRPKAAEQQLHED